MSIKVGDTVCVEHYEMLIPDTNGDERMLRLKTTKGIVSRFVDGHDNYIEIDASDIFKSTMVRIKIGNIKNIDKIKKESV